MQERHPVLPIADEGADLLVRGEAGVGNAAAAPEHREVDFTPGIGNGRVAHNAGWVGEAASTLGRHKSPWVSDAGWSGTS